MSKIIFDRNQSKTEVFSHSFLLRWRTFFAKHPFLMAFVYNLALFLLFVYVGHAAYETNDDYTMTIISSGAIGTSSPYLPFSQLWLGWVVQQCFRLLPGINWLSLYQYFIMLAGFTAISTVLFSSENKKVHGPLGVVLPFLVAPFFYSTLQFTRASTLCAVAGCLVIYYSLFKGEKPLIKVAIVGWGLVFLGVSLRMDAFILSVLPFCFLVFCQFLASYQKEKGWHFSFKAYKKRFQILVVGLLAIIAAIAIDGALSNRYYSEYNRYNTARSEIVDSPQMKYKDYAEEFKALGLNENDLDMVYHLHFDDPAVFSIEVIEELGMIAKAQKRETSFKLAEFINSYYEYLSTGMFVFVLAAFIGALILNKGNRRLAVVFLMILLLAVAAAFLLIVQRFPIRVQDSLSLSFLILFIISFPWQNRMENKKGKTSIKQTLRGSLAWLTLTFVLLGSTSLPKVYLAFFEPAGHAVLYDFFISEPEKIYISDTQTTINYLIPNGVFKAWPVGAFQNSISTGSWLTNHPVVSGQKVKLGLLNMSIFEALYQDQVYYITGRQENAKMVLDYLQDHLNPKTKMKEVDQAVHHAIFQFYIQE